MACFPPGPECLEQSLDEARCRCREECPCKTKEAGSGNDCKNIDDRIDADRATDNTRREDVILKVLQQDEQTKGEQSRRPSLCEGKQDNRCSRYIDTEKGDELENKGENGQEKGIGNADQSDTDACQYAKDEGKRHCATNISSNHALRCIEQKIDLVTLTQRRSLA